MKYIEVTLCQVHTEKKITVGCYRANVIQESDVDEFNPLRRKLIKVSDIFDVKSLCKNLNTELGACCQLKRGDEICEKYKELYK